jgi:hypothetical protein
MQGPAWPGRATAGKPDCAAAHRVRVVHFEPRPPHALAAVMFGDKNAPPHVPPDPGSPRVHEERARLLTLRMDAQLQHVDQAVLDAIQIGLDALSETPPALTVAARIRRHVADALSGTPTFLRLIGGSILPTAVMIALLFRRVFSDDLLDTFQFELWSLQRIALIGAFGGFVSVLLRIRDFAELKGSQIDSQLFSGLFRPFISAAFALLLFFVLKSGLVSTPLTSSPDPTTSTAFYFVVAFLAGFSERLAPLIVSKTEEAFTGHTSAESRPPTGTAPMNAEH